MYLDHIVELLEDGRHHEAADAAEEEAEGEEELRGGGGRGQLVEDGGGEQRGGRGHEVHHEGHRHPVQVQPELLLQEVLTRVLMHRVTIRAANDPSVFTITEKAHTRAFSWQVLSHLRHYQNIMLSLMGVTHSK